MNTVLCYKNLLRSHTSNKQGKVVLIIVFLFSRLRKSLTLSDSLGKSFKKKMIFSRKKNYLMATCLFFMKCENNLEKYL